MKKLLIFITIIMSANCSPAQWVRQYESNYNHRYDNVFFIDQDYGWVSGDGTLFTSNGGEDWEDGSPNYPWGSIFFTNQDNGWICGEYSGYWNELSLWHTNNGSLGTNADWTLQLNIDPFDYYNSCLYFLDDSTGYLACSNGPNFANTNRRIYKTTDGGNTWDLTFGPASGIFHDMYFTDALHGMAFGGRRKGKIITYDSTILYTNDGGLNWYTADSSINEAIISVSFINPQTGWALGRVVVMLDWANFIYYTSDGGNTWEERWIYGMGERLHGIEFIDENNGWLVGDHGKIFHTTDGGYTWETQESTTHADLYSVFFTDLNNGWIGGDSGLILHYDGMVDIHGSSLTDESQLYIYPNPANDILNIEIQSESNASEIEIYTIQGVLIRKMNINGPEHKMNISDISKGIYVLKVMTGNQVLSKKLVIN